VFGIVYVIINQMYIYHDGVYYGGCYIDAAYYNGVYDVVYY